MPKVLIISYNYYYLFLLLWQSLLLEDKEKSLGVKPKTFHEQREGIKKLERFLESPESDALRLMDQIARVANNVNQLLGDDDIDDDDIDDDNNSGNNGNSDNNDNKNGNANTENTKTTDNGNNK